MADLNLPPLEAMGLAELHGFWLAHFPSSPPSGRAIDLVRHEIAWRLQASQFGGLDPASERLLRTHARVRTREEVPPPTVARTIEPGTTLVRNWRGETHHVKATADGFSYDGRSYRSLTAIAFAITGARWSGPRFFGLADTAP